MRTASDNPTTSAPSRAVITPMVVLGAGIIAAFGVGKLPGVLPAIQADLAISLFQASFLVAMFQLAGALIGVFAGAMADRFGHRRQMQLGLLVILMGSLLGGLAQSSALLLVSRAIESLGFILAALPGPSLLRAHVTAQRQNRWLSAWGTYMPAGVALGLVVAPWLAGLTHWRSVWFAHALLCGAGAWMLVRFLPADRQDTDQRSRGTFMRLLRETVTSTGPWMLAISFGAYAGQYLSIIAFLPTIYQQAGISASAAGGMTALVALINVLGNISAGQLIHRRVSAPGLIMFAALVLLFGAWLVYASDLSFMARYAVVVIVSAVMGLVPGSLFVLAARYAPRPEAVSTTVGLMQQGSALGQLILPVAVGWLATQSAGWHNTWLATGAFASVNLLLALLMLRRDRHAGSL